MSDPLADLFASPAPAKPATKAAPDALDALFAPPPSTAPSLGEAMARGGIQVPSLGLADEMTAAIKSNLGGLGSGVADPFGRHPELTRDWKPGTVEDFRAEKKKENARDDEAAASHPVGYYGTGVLGGVATAPLTAGMGLVRGGLALGAASGFGGSRADLTNGEFGQAALDTGVGAAIGGAVGAGGKYVPKAAGYVAKKGLDYVGPKAVAIGELAAEYPKLTRAAESLIPGVGKVKRGAGALAELFERFGSKAADDVVPPSSSAAAGASRVADDVTSTTIDASEKTVRDSGLRDMFKRLAEQKANPVDDVLDDTAVDLGAQVWAKGQAKGAAGAATKISKRGADTSVDALEGLTYVDDAAKQAAKKGAFAKRAAEAADDTQADIAQIVKRARKATDVAVDDAPKAAAAQAKPATPPPATAPTPPGRWGELVSQEVERVIADRAAKGLPVNHAALQALQRYRVQPIVQGRAPQGAFSPAFKAQQGPLREAIIPGLAKSIVEDAAAFEGVIGPMDVAIRSGSVRAVEAAIEAAKAYGPGGVALAQEMAANAGPRTLRDVFGANR